ncbi:MAG: glycyl-radical enzyme activating protein, partial [Bacillota bacterium]
FGRCREQGIRTALDTCGCVPWSVLEEVLPLTDLFLYDLKGVDPQKHREWTGVGNETILDNLIRLTWSRAGHVRIRVPLIPGFNDGDDDLRKMAKFLSRIPVQGLDVLPYHSFGEAKYRALGLGYRLSGVPDYDYRLAEEKIPVLRAAVKDVTIGG